MTETVANPPASPPPAVKRAVLCLWLSWLVGFIRAPIQLEDPVLRAKLADSLAMAQAMHPDAEVDPDMLTGLVNGLLYGGLALGFLISLGITALVLRKLKQGRDWARILCLVWGAICALGLLKINALTLSNGLTIASLALGYYALYLVFTAPGAAWFRRQPVVETPDAKW